MPRDKGTPPGTHRAAGRLLGLLLLALALAAPWRLGAYHLTFLMQLYMMVALAQSWNFLSGMTGYVSFGHIAFFGVGAYTGAILVTQGVAWGLSVLAGAGAALLVALPLGMLTLRLRGPYFAIAMLGLNEVGRIIATLWVSLTEGGDGIALAPALLPPLTHNYFTMLALAVTAMVLAETLYHSRFGLELRAIREEEDVAEMVGVDTVRNKVLAFLLSAVLPGAVGVSYALFTSYIDPVSVFAPDLNVQMIVMVLLGGSGTVWGPALGAAIIMGLRELLWAQFPALHLMLMGLLLILVVLYLPNGLLSFFARRRGQRPDQGALATLTGAAPVETEMAPKAKKVAMKEATEEAVTPNGEIEK